MDAIISRISDDPKADSGFTYAQIRGPGFAVLHGSNASTRPSLDLFGGIEQIRVCEHCHKPIFKPRKNQKVHGECRTPYRKQREAAAKLAVRNSREREAMEWIKDNPAVIYYIVSEVKSDPMYQFTKIQICFRRFWENARREYPETTFDNNHSKFVSRYIMEHYPELAGVFRTRN